jgi:GNAT superfamily N-acetyltransferase
MRVMLADDGAGSSRAARGLRRQAACVHAGSGAGRVRDRGGRPPVALDGPRSGFIRTLWGGSTAAEWRRRGIYRVLVSRRAHLAAERGFRYLQVDASDDSRPILERLGFVAVTTTTPYMWRPGGRGGQLVV